MLSPFVGHAQSVPALASARTGNGVATDPFAQRITLHLQDVTLDVALKTIAQHASLKIAYANDMVPKQLVSVNAKNTQVDDVLVTVLKGTGLIARISGEGLLSIVRRPDAAQAQGTIVGKVVSAKTKLPIAGATVTIGDASKGVVTNDDGTFRLVAPAGQQTLRVRAVGFTRHSSQVTVVQEKEIAVSVTLEPSTSVLNEVIVTGTVVTTERKAIPTPITVITAEDLEKRNITRVDQLFRGEVPGVVAMERGAQRYNAGDFDGTTLGSMVTSTVYARGASGFTGQAGTGSATPLKTYVDGVELLDPSYLGTIDPKSIERIEIITGPQAATIYGSGAMGGVMQIFTKKGTQGASQATLSVKYGVLENNLNSGNTPMHNDMLSVAGGGGSDFSYSANLSYLYNGQWQPGLFSRTYGLSVGAVNTRGPVTLTGSAATTSGRNGTTVGTRTLLLRANRESGEWVSTTPLAYYSSNRVSTSASQSVSLGVDYRLGQIWQHHLTLGRNQTDFAVTPQAPRWAFPYDTLYGLGSSTGHRASLAYNMTLATPKTRLISSTLTIGGDGSDAEQIQNTGCVAVKSDTYYGDCPRNGFVTQRAINKTLDERRWGMFGTWQLGFFDQLFLTVAARGEHNPFYGKDHTVDWTPRYGAAYSREHGDLTVKLLGSYGRATRPPDPTQRLAYYADGSYEPSGWQTQLEAPNLRPEDSRGPQGGVELYYGNLASVTVNHYRQTVDNLIQFVVVDSIYATLVGSDYSGFFQQYQWQNVAKVGQSGWDATASMNLGPVALKGTYSWIRSRVLAVDPTTSDASFYYRGMEFEGVPSHTGNVTATYALGKTSVTLATNYVGQTSQSALDNMWYYASQYSRLKMYTSRIVSYDYRKLRFTKPGYAKTDLGISQRLTTAVSATLNVTNLGNSYGTDVGSLDPALGRQTLLGVSVRFPGSR